MSTLKGKIDALNELINKKEFLNQEYEYVKDIQKGIECVETVKGPQIGVYTDSFGEEVDYRWEFGLMMVNREDFLAFLKVQRDKHIATVNKMIDEVCSQDL